MRRKTIGLTLALTLAGGVHASATATAAPADDWSQCGPAECRTVSVPLDHSQPAGRRIDIAIARLKAADPARRIGTLVVLPSTSGESGRSRVSTFSQELSSRFDIVAIDPRGTGASTPVKCSLDLWANHPNFRPADAAEFEEVIGYNSALWRDCRQTHRDDPNRVSSAAVAEDIEVIRKSLGEQKISIHADRFSTVAAQQYAARHGDRVRALVLDSVVDPSVSARTFAESSARVADRTFTEWVRWNERTPASPLHGKDVNKLWADALAKAENPAAFGEMAAARLSEPEGWSDLSKLLAGQATNSVATAADEETLTWAASSYFCADYRFRVDSIEHFRSLFAAEKRLAPRTLGSAYSASWLLGCTGIGHDSLPTPIISTAPKALIINARYDETAPLEVAESVHRKFPSALVTYEGFGSGVYPRSECTRGVTDRYLVDLTIPAKGTKCAAVEPTV